MSADGLKSVQSVTTGEERHACGCLTNLPGAREGLRLYRPCRAMEDAYERYRKAAPRLFESRAERAIAEQEWERIASHIKAQRSGKAKGRTAQGRLADAHWGKS